MSVPALEFLDVSVRHAPAGPAVLSGLTFRVGPGEKVALVGLNGSGKTTLLMAAVGLVAHAGEIRVGGENLTRRTLARTREKIGFLFNVPEDQLLFPRAADDVAFGLLRRGLPPAEAAAQARDALAALGADHLADASVHHLSHGEKQRVALAGALVTDPALLLLDEPSSGLDPPARKALAGRLAGLDAAMVIATHDLEFAARVCTRYLMLEQGCLGFEGTEAGEILRRWE